MLNLNFKDTSIYLILFLFLLGLGCSTKNSNVKLRTLAIEVFKDSLSLDFDKEPIRALSILNPYKDSIISYYSYLTGYIISKPFGFGSNDISRTLKPPKFEGYVFENFTGVGADSIVLFYKSEDSFKMVLFYESEIISIRDLPLFIENEGVEQVISEINKFDDIQFCSQSNKVFLPLHAYLTLWEKERFEQKILMSYSFKENATSFCNVSFPPFYQKTCVGHAIAHFSCIGRDGNILFSFEGSSDLVKYYPIKEKSKIFNVKSNLYNEMREFDTTFQEDFNLIFKHLFDNTRFYSVKYDPYRELYYRLLVLGKLDETEINKIEGKSNNMYLQVFDKDLNLLKEINVGNSDEMKKIFLVTKKGIYIPKQYKDEDSRTMYFDVYNISNAEGM